MLGDRFKDLAKLAIPLVLAQLAQNTVSFVDTLMVGRLGNEALAGIALGSTFFHFVSIILAGVILGVGPIVSQATGSGDEDKCGRAARQGIWMGLLLFLPAFFLFRNAYPIFIWMKQPEVTAAASAEYLKAISWGMLPSLWIWSLRSFLEGKSNTRPIMLIFFAGIVFNVVANDTLMFGKYGFPKLGLVGTGYASAIVFLAVFLMLLGYVIRSYPSANIIRGLRSPDWKMLRELAAVGVPIGLTLAFEGSMFSAAAVAMGTLGENQLAAHQIALQTASITFMIPLGFALATSVLVGQATGAGQIRKAELAGYTGMLTCVAVMACTGLLLWLLPKSIIGLYLDLDSPENGQVIEFATQFLMIAAVFQVVDGLQVAANGSLRGLKDTKATMVLSLVSYWCVGCVLGAFMCFKWGFGGDGLWWGMTVGLATAAVLLTLRFRYQIKRLADDVREDSTLAERV